jgi:hypothetical protein
MNPGATANLDLLDGFFLVPFQRIIAQFPTTYSPITGVATSNKHGLLMFFVGYS